ncbi:MAG TPA: phage tail tape measure protein [Candidatus Hydrogenedentes bacterium]|nr:phage tail tape measure protein [Candidatus Hydrogenedentota bacterium]HPG66486.1 phage tail tape measure protein [Candidatus Hydrogenedentota bacterium]
MNDLGLGVIVSMKDAFSRNAMRVQSSMQSLDASVAAASERMTRNLDRIQKGTMMIGAGLAMLAVPSALVASTVESQKALGELASLGVEDLNAIENAAESFTNQWAGTRKAQFITATYDVKSALASLSDEAVGVFTRMAALTGKATKATTDEMVGTFTTAYGIFKPIMADMSDMEWATAFSGALSQTVAAFKTTGRQMADAIKNIGAVAAASHVPLEEQLAILGQLQTTMPGSEAGTLYKAFMMKAAEAGEELGLSFTDSSGRLKGVVDVLREVQRQFPDLSQAAAQVQLKKAFGSDEAVKFVLQMSQGLGALEGNIQSIQKAMLSGAAVTEEMANAMNMDIGAQFLLLRQQLGNLFETLGKTLLPVVAPVIGGISKVILFLQRMAKASPGVTRVVLTLSMALGGILVAAGGVVAGIGMLGLALPAIKAGILAIGASAAGVGSAIAAWFLPVTAAIAGVVLAVYLMKKAWETNFGGIRDMVVGVWEKARLAIQGIQALVGSLNGGVGQMSAELAQKLEAAGLMGFVTTVFRIYHRVREFLAGLWGAFSEVFGRIRAILEPAVQSLMTAFGALGRAVFSILEVFGVAAGATDGASWRSFGKVVGTVAGVLLQGLAYALRVVVWNLSLIVRGLAIVVRAVTWAAKIIVSGLVWAGQFAYRFLLPVRMIAQAFVAAGRIIHAVWRVLTGDMSLVDGLKAIAGAVGQFLLTPFRRAKDVLAGLWSGLKAVPSAIGSLFSGLGEVILLPFRLIGRVFDWIRGLFTSDGGGILGNVFSFGASILRTLGAGILSLALFPLRLLQNVFEKVIGFFSGGESGLLSRAFEFGAGILKALASGIASLFAAPLEAIVSLGGALLSALGRIPEGIASLFSGIGNILAAPFEAGAAVAGILWETVRTGASSAFETVTAAAQSILPGLQSVWSGIKEGLNGFAQGVQSAATGIHDAMTGAFARIGERATALWNGLRDGIASVVGAIQSGLASVASAAGNVLGKAKDIAASVGGTVMDVGRGALKGVGEVAGGIWGGLKSAASWVAGTEAPQPVGTPPPAPVTVPVAAVPVITQQVSLIPRLREEFVPRALEAALNLKPVLTEQLPKLFAEVMLRLDTSLIPRTFQAALLLTPVIAGAVPDTFAATSIAQPAPITMVQASQEPAFSALAVPPGDVEAVARPVILESPALPLDTGMNMARIPAPVVTPRMALPEAPAINVPVSAQLWDAPTILSPMTMDVLPRPVPELELGTNLQPLSMPALDATIAGNIIASSPELPDVDLPAQLYPAVPGMMNVPGLVDPITIGSFPGVPDFEAPLHLSPDVPALPRATLAAQVQPAVPSLAPLTLPAMVSAAMPRLAPATMPIQWEMQQPSLPGAVPVDLLPQALGPMPPVTAAPSMPSPELPVRRMEILTEQRQRQGDTGETVQDRDASFRMLLEGVMARLDAVAERPIDLAVTTQIDGRVVAEAVYKDMREQKIRNYETL